MGEMTTCWDLLEEAALGQAAEMEQFCLRYRPLIEEFLAKRWRTRGGAQEIEDATQETLMECLKEKGAIESAVHSARGRFRGFLYGVTMNVARRFDERRARRGRLGDRTLPPPELVADPEPDPEREFDRSWASNVLLNARRLLMERAELNGADMQRRCRLLELRFEEGQPIREIAVEWKLPPEQVHKEYARARKEFRAALEETLRFECQGADLDLDQELRDLIELAGTK